MTDTTAPRTAAGKRLLDDFEDYAMRDPLVEGLPRTYAFEEQTLRMWVAAIEAEAIEPLLALVRPLTEAKNALALTYTNVPSDGSRPHWCHFPAPAHEGICAGMMATQDMAREVLAALPESVRVAARKPE